MIIVDKVELSKNVVSTNEVFIIRIEVHEELATWNNVKTKKWNSFLSKTWDQVKRKIF